MILCVIIVVAIIYILYLFATNPTKAATYMAYLIVGLFLIWIGSTFGFWALILAIFIGILIVFNN